MTGRSFKLESRWVIEGIEGWWLAMQRAGAAYEGTSSTILRVIIVDDHTTLAQLLEAALRDQPDIECVGYATSGEAGLALADEMSPDVVVMDHGLPGMDGVEATARLRISHPQTRVIMLTAAANPHLVARAAAAGICAFVPKNGGLDELLTAIRGARQGAMVVSTSVLAGLASGTSARDSTTPPPVLTPRERDVLELLALGLDASRVARRLGISLHTCRSYLKSLMAKLDSHSQLEAVVTATRLGLLGIARGA
jgi:DNA-binding NarL/FixJ family response regulator